MIVAEWRMESKRFARPSPGRFFLPRTPNPVFYSGSPIFDFFEWVRELPSIFLACPNFKPENPNPAISSSGSKPLMEPSYFGFFLPKLRRQLKIFSLSPKGGITTASSSTASLRTSWFNAEIPPEPAVAENRPSATNSKTKFRRNSRISSAPFRWLMPVPIRTEVNFSSSRAVRRNTSTETTASLGRSFPDKKRSTLSPSSR